MSIVNTESRGQLSSGKQICGGRFMHQLVLKMRLDRIVLLQTTCRQILGETQRVAKTTLLMCRSGYSAPRQEMDPDADAPQCIIGPQARDLFSTEEDLVYPMAAPHASAVISRACVYEAVL